MSVATSWHGSKTDHWADSFYLVKPWSGLTNLPFECKVGVEAAFSQRLYRRFMLEKDDELVRGGRKRRKILSHAKIYLDWPECVMGTYL